MEGVGTGPGPWLPQVPLAGSISMAIGNEPAEIRYSPHSHSSPSPDNRTGVNSHRQDTLDTELLHSPPHCHTHTPWLSAPPKILFLVRSATLLARPCLSPLSTHPSSTIRPQTTGKEQATAPISTSSPRSTDSRRVESRAYSKLPAMASSKVRCRPRGSTRVTWSCPALT